MSPFGESKITMSRFFVNLSNESLIVVGDREAICSERKEIGEGTQKFDELGIEK